MQLHTFLFLLHFIVSLISPSPHHNLITTLDVPHHYSLITRTPSQTQYQAVGGSTEPSILSKDGKERHDAGEAEIKAAQAKDFAEGTADRIVGKKGELRAAPSRDHLGKW